MVRKTSALVAALAAFTILVPLAGPADAQLWRRDRGWIIRPVPPPVIARRPPLSRVYREPAAARGYADGYEEGLRDARDRDRYDPVRNRAYRNGDSGYYREYGPRDAYRNNYRLGFRQGYEDGYRDGRR